VQTTINTSCRRINKSSKKQEHKQQHLISTYNRASKHDSQGTPRECDKKNENPKEGIKLGTFPAQMEHMVACEVATRVTMSRFHSAGHVTVHSHRI